MRRELLACSAFFYQGWNWCKQRMWFERWHDLNSNSRMELQIKPVFYNLIISNNFTVLVLATHPDDFHWFDRTISVEFIRTGIYALIWGDLVSRSDYVLSSLKTLEGRWRWEIKFSAPWWRMKRWSRNRSYRAAVEPAKINNFFVSNHHKNSSRRTGFRPECHPVSGQP